MFEKRKHPIVTATIAILVLAGFFLYSEYFSEEGRFRRDVTARLVTLEKGGAGSVPLISFGNEWQVICVLGPYQSGRLLIDEERAVSAWIRSQKEIALEDMPVSLENEWLLAFGFENKLVTLRFRRNQFHFRGKETGIKYRSCWMREDVVREKLHFQSDQNFYVLKRGNI